MNTIIDIKVNNEEYDKNDISRIESLCKNNKELTEEDINTLLCYISYTVRQTISNYELKSIDEYLYPLKCDLAQSMIYYYLKDLNIETNPININEIIPNVKGHSLIISKFKTVDGEKQYLIDPTYIQFFSKEECSEDKFIIINDMICNTPDPGYFIVKNNDTEEIKPLLDNGFIELTDEISKIYGDSFYKTKTSIPNSFTEYNEASGPIYKKWLNSYTSRLSKTKEELKENNLLIEPIKSKVIKL